MAKSYLDDNGLLYFWGKIKSYVSSLLSGKQDTINDLSDIRSGAAKGATAVQTETDPVFSASAAAGIQSSDISNWNSKTSNVGTVTKVKVNDTEKSPNSSGVVDIGTVITAHQTVTDNNPALAWGTKSKVATIGSTEINVTMPSNPNANTFPSAHCATDGGTAAKVATCTDYALLSKSYVHVLMKNANSSAGAITLNINGKGAKPVYINGAASSSNNYTLPAGTYLVYFNGTNYYFRTDGKLTSDGVVVLTSHQDISGKVDKTTTVNGHALSGNITVTKSDVGLGNVTNDAQVKRTEMGAANGVATLGSDGKVPSSQLPSYVDDVIEAYARSGQTALSQNWLATGSASGTVITPETGKIYVLMADTTDYAANTQFRWSVTAYVKLNDGGVSAITNAEIDTIVAS